jgi:hypothetical protein
MGVPTKEWYKSKTVWVNVLAMIGGICVSVSGELATGTTLTLFGLANIVLRVITSTKLTA